MLNNKILQNKPLIIYSNDTGQDLLYKSINFKENIGGKYLKVNEYYVARPDLISFACYGTDIYGDVLCKINGISNPFELNEGTILFIPEYESLTVMCDVTPEQSEKNTVIDKDTIFNNGKIGNQKLKNETRSPNEQIIGDQNYIIDKSLGVVIY